MGDSGRAKNLSRAQGRPAALKASGSETVCSGGRERSGGGMRHLSEARSLGAGSVRTGLCLATVPGRASVAIASSPLTRIN